MIINTRNASVVMAATLWAVITAGTSHAHDTWLLPDRFEITPKQAVTLQLTSGMTFPELESGPKRERVESANYRLAGRTREISDITAGPKALTFKSELVETGIATFSVKLPPKSIELKPDQVQEYLEEIDAPAAVRKQWADEKEPKRWRESYTKHVKTFVRVGSVAAADRSWATPAGIALEIVPEKEPTSLREGEDFPVQVLKNGKPFPDFSVNAVAAGESKGETRKTDASGRVTFRLSKQGRWLLRGTDVRKSTRDDADWESDFTTLTIEAKPK